jgi:predicted nucleic-acid-binding protein
MAARATAALAAADELMLADVVLAECVYVLESFYQVARRDIAELMRAAIAMPSIRTVDGASLLRALEVYEVDRLDFAEAYLVAQAETTGVGAILTFDRSRSRQDCRAPGAVASSAPPDRPPCWGGRPGSLRRRH